LLTVVGAASALAQDVCGELPVTQATETIRHTSAGGQDLTAILTQISADFSAPITHTAGGTKLIAMQQYFRSLPVIGGRLSVRYDNADRPTSIQGVRKTVADSVPTTAAIEPGEAIVAVADWLQANVAPPGQLLDPVQPAVSELAIHVDDQGISRLVYRIVQPTWKAVGFGGTYAALVDAGTGSLLTTPTDINQYSGSPKGPLGRIYKSGNPMAGLDRPKLKDSDAIPLSAYRNVVLEHLFSPSELIGQYVDMVALTSYPATPVDGDFLFRRNADDPAEGAKLDAVMAYYHIDQAQQFLQRNGAAIELQRSIRVNVNGSTGSQSFYSPAEDFIMLSSGGVDAGEDAEAILHEYFHAVQEWANPGVWQGASNPGVCAGTQAMAEGFSDFFATQLTNQKPPFRFLVAEWAATTQGQPARDLRATYRYPEESTGDEYHDGNLWTGALKDIYQRMTTAAIPLFLDTMALIEPNATFTDGAHLILQSAKQRAYPAARLKSLVQAFSRRGILGSDLEVTIMPPPDQVKAGLEFSYDITFIVANHGPEAATAGSLTGKFGKPGRLLSAPQNCQITENTFECALQTLESGAETSITLTMAGANPGRARVAANAQLAGYSDDSVDPGHWALLDRNPANNSAAATVRVVDWCADVSGTWNGFESLNLVCRIPERVVLDTYIENSAPIEIRQTGCKISWRIPGGFGRSGTVKRNRVSASGTLAKIVSSPGLSIQFYNNKIILQGTYSDQSIDNLKARAVVNGKGCAGDQCRNFSCSTPGGISVSLTR
jgi:hypothetical protein